MPTEIGTHGPNAAIGESVTPSQATKVWLPVGTIVPVGESIDAPPEPYDPVRHGPALKSAVEFENLANKPGFERFPKRRGPSGSSASNVVPPPGNGDRGFQWNQTTRPWFGASAMYDLNLNLQLPTPWGGHDMYVYAPTMMPPAVHALRFHRFIGDCMAVRQPASCLEFTTGASPAPVPLMYWRHR